MKSLILYLLSRAVQEIAVRVIDVDDKLAVAAEEALRERFDKVCKAFKQGQLELKHAYLDRFDYAAALDKLEAAFEKEKAKFEKRVCLVTMSAYDE